MADTDVTHILPAIQVPTLVVHRVGDPLEPVAEGRSMRPEVPLEIAILTLIGVLTLAISAVVVRRPVPSFEVDLFQAVNGLPASLNTVVWPLMQYGTFLTIPVLALVAFALGRARLAIVMLAAGLGVYVTPRAASDSLQGTRRWRRRSPV